MMGQIKFKLSHLAFLIGILALIADYCLVEGHFGLGFDHAFFIRQRVVYVLALVALTVGFAGFSVHFSRSGWCMASVITLAVDVFILLSAIFVEFGLPATVLRYMLHDGGLLPLWALNTAVFLHWVFRKSSE
ncbi:MAG: hypothetical protein E6Z06_04855 [Clostridiales bacterium]|nr:hypothetical protein [Clostridiales bacterium]